MTKIMEKEMTEKISFIRLVILTSVLLFSGIGASFAADNIFTDKVGIGTTSPSYNLDVTGDIRATGTIYGTGGTQVPIGTGTTNYVPKWSASGTLGNSIMFDNGTNVGIGTASPGAKLAVKGGNDNTFFLDNDGSQFTWQYFKNNGTTKANLGWDNTNNQFWIGPSAASAPLILQTVGTEKVRIDSSGNVGIGTTNPGVPLQVVNASGNSFQANHGIYAVGTGTDTGFTTNNYRLYQDTNNKLGISGYGTSSVVFGIDTSGNVGIGTTNPAGKLDVRGGVLVAGYSGGQIQVTGGTVDGGIWTGSTDILKVANWNDQTKGIAINMTSGNVGIGTVSPQNKLDTRGTIGVSISDTQTVAKLYQSASDGFLELFTGDSTPVSRIKLSAYGDSYIVSSGTGLVGIGTAAPSAKLQVASPSSTVGGLYVTGSAYNGADQMRVYYGGSYVALGEVNGAAGIKKYGQALPIHSDSPIGFGAPKVIVTNSGWSNDIWSNAVSKQFQVYGDSYFSGLVGIGTTTVNNRLQLSSTDSSSALQFNISGYPSSWGARVFTQDGYNGAANGIDLAVEVQLSSGAWYNSASFGHGQDANHPSLRTWYTTNLATNSGSVGIGTTAPNAKLDISSTTANAANIHLSERSTSGGEQGGLIWRGYYNATTTLFDALAIKRINIDDSNTASNQQRLGFFIRNPIIDGALVEKMSIRETGNVGIGTTAPAYKLDVSGDIRATGTIYGTGGTQVPIGTGTTNYIPKWSASGTLGNSIVFDNGTNVGVGTASPGYKLEVESTVSGDGIGIGYNGGVKSIWKYASSANYDTVFGALSNNALTFVTGGVEKMRISDQTSGGLVGIGTASPQYKLDVANGQYRFGQQYSAANVGLMLYNALTAVSGSAVGFDIRTDLTASANNNILSQMNFGGAVYATGTYTGLTASQLRLAGSNMGASGTGTIDNAALIWIVNAPTLATNNYAIKVDAGTSYFGGNVGIGTGAPRSKLHVANSDIVLSNGQGIGVEYGGSYRNAITLNWDGVTKIRPTDNSTGRGVRIEDWAGNVGLFVDANNTNVGVGTASPQATLNVIGSSSNDATTASFIIGGIGDANLRMGYYANASGYSWIQSHGSKPLILNQIGNNVGIGTVAPAYKLDVSGDIRATGTIYGTGGTQVPIGTGTTNYVPKWSASGTLGNSLIYDNGTNVGISMASPTAKLTVQVGTAPHSSATGLAVTAGAGGANLLSRETDTYHNWLPYTDGNNYYSAQNHVFRMQGSPWTEYMWIKSGGNVGIGTANPGAQLHISGAAADNAFVRLTSTTASTGSTGTGPNINFFENATRRAWFGFLDSAATGGASTFNMQNNNGDLRFAAGAGAWDQFRLTIKGDTGNVGIGTAGPDSPLHIAGPSQTTALHMAHTWDGGADAQTMLKLETTRTSNGGTSPQIYFKDNFAGGYNWKMGGDDTGIDFSIIKAASGTFPNTYVMKFQGSTGNVGIGTASPGYKLDVAGGAIRTSSSNTGGLIVQAAGTASNQAAIAIQQLTAEGWTAIFADFEPYTGWGLYHDNPSNYIIVTSEASAGNLGSTTVLNRAGSSRTAYYKHIFDQNDGDMFVGGNVGIGTTSPSGKLQVSGGYVVGDKNYGFVNADYQGGRNFVWSVSPTTTNWGISYFQGGADYFAFHPNGDPNNPLMVVRSPGVGIGTVSPGTNLQIGNYASTGLGLRFGASGDGTSQIQFYDGNSTEGAYIKSTGQTYGAKLYFGARWDDDNDKIVFNVRKNYDPLVGIGTVSPQTVLHAYASTSDSSGAGRTTPLNVLTLESENTGAVEFGGFGQAIVFRGSTYNNSTQRTLGRIVHTISDDSISTTRGTAIRFETSDNAVTGGEPTEKMRIDYNGYIGIGTGSPSYKLDVSGDIRATGTIYGASGTQVPIGTGTTNYHPKWTASGTLGNSIVYDDGTNVGIGTASPVYKLTVDNNGPFLRGRRADATRYRSDFAVASSGLNINAYDDTGGAYLPFTIDGNPVVLGLRGNVGINTTSPEALLNIRQSAPTGTGGVPSNTALLLDSNSHNYITFRNTADNGTYQGLQFLDNNVGGYIVFQNWNGAVPSDSMLLGTYQDIYFQTGSSGTVGGKNTVMTIKQGGSVGIGTASPSQTLEIGGTKNTILNFGTDRTLTTSTFSSLDKPAYATYIYETGSLKRYYGMGQTVYGLSFIANDEGGSGGFINFITGNLTSSSGAATERMRISNSGNVGIGTTNPDTLLHVGGATTKVRIGTTYSGSGGWASNRPAVVWDDGTVRANAQIVTGSNLFVIGTETAHQMKFDTSGSTKMVINSDGNVGIGTGAPGALLQVANNATNNTAFQGILKIMGANSSESSTGSFNESAPSYGIVFRRWWTPGGVGYENDQAGIYAWGSSSWGSGLAFRTSVAGPTMTTRMVITDNGDVGIGTTSPAYKLDVSGDIRATGTIYGASGTQVPIGTGTTNYVPKWSASGTLGNSIVYDTGTNVGIGTTGPGQKLDVRGNAYFGGHDAFIYIEDTTGGSTGKFRIGVGQAADGLFEIRDATSADTSANTRLAINSAGNVGIGTASPGEKLTVTGGNISATSGNLHTNRGRLAFSNTAGDANHTIYNNYNNIDNEGGWDGMKMNVYNGLNVRVGNANSATPTSALYVNSSANVGIGTMSPGGLGSGAPGPYLNILSSSTTGSSEVYVGGAGVSTANPYMGVYGFATTGTAQGDKRIGWLAGELDANSATNTSGRLTFWTSNAGSLSEKMRITSAGNVGIGTAFVLGGYTTGRAMQISTGVAKGGSSGTMNHGLYVGSSDASNPLVIAMGHRNSGTYILSTEIGASGNDLTLNETMTLKYGGNVGIGTASPSYKLDVTGDIRATGTIYGASGTQVPIGTGTTNYLPKWTASGTLGNSVIYDTGTNVGVGVNPSSGAKFEVAGTLRVHTGNNWDAVQISSDGTNGYITGLGDETGLRIRSEYGNVILADNRGNVGIGTASPQSKLDFGTSVANQKLIIGTYVTGNTWTGIGMDATSAGIRLAGDYANNILVDIGSYSFDANHNWTSSVIVKNNGNVGIGTTNPGGPLGRGTYRDDVAVRTSPAKILEIVSGGTSELIITSFYDDATRYPAITLRKADADQSWPDDDEVTGVINFAANDSVGAAGENEWMDVARIVGRMSGAASNNSAAGDLEFWTNPGNMTSSQRMVILANGYVGIGTVSPSYKLDVSGDIRLTGNLYAPAGGSTQGYWALSGNSLAPTSTSYNVGIGTASPGYKLDVAGTASISSSLTMGGRIYVGTFPNSTVNSGEAWFGRVSDRALGNFVIQLGGVDNAPSFSVVDRGWTYNAFNVNGVGDGTFYGKLVVSGTGNSSFAGNVGIGTAGPIAPLDIKRVHAASYGTLIPLINLNAYFPGYDENAQRADIEAGVPPVSFGNTTYGWMAFRTRGADGITERMTIYPNGNVGIGTTGPVAKLDIKTPYETSKWALIINQSSSVPLTAATHDEVLIQRDDVASMKIYDVGDGGLMSLAAGDGDSDIASVGPLKFWTGGSVSGQPYAGLGGTLAMTITGGNVGIGTAGPLGKLQVHGDGTVNTYSGVLRLFDTSGNNWGYISLASSAAGTAATDTYYLIGRGAAISDRTMSFHIPNASNYGDSTQPYFRWASSGADTLMTLQASTGNAYIKGNVGIGTAGPKHKLDVIGNLGVGPVAANYSDEGHNLHIWSSDIGAYGYGYGSQPANLLIEENDAEQSIAFLGPNTATQKIVFGRLANNAAGQISFNHNTDQFAITGGNVGIGTTNPYVNLVVRGAGDSYGNAIGIIDTDSAVQNWLLVAKQNGDFSIHQSGISDRITVQNGGNVGIGTANPIFALDVKPGVASTVIRAGSYAVMENVTTDQAMFGRNVQYASSAAGWTYLNNGYATAIRMYDDPGDGSIAFHLAPSGTAGANLPNWDGSDKKMTIRNNGNVGIGTASPSYKLDVTGDIRATGTIYGTGGTQVPIGTGTTNYVPKWTAGGTLGNSSIVDTGNVGIGTASPGALLHVKHPTGNLITRFEGATNSYTSKLYISSVSSGDGGIYYDGNNLMNIFSYGPLMFNVGTGNVSGAIANERMRITQGGNVGINTTSPSSTLHVNGPISVYEGVATSNYPILTKQTSVHQYLSVESTGTYEAMTRYYNPTAGHWYTGIRSSDDTSAYHIYSSTYSGDVFRIGTNGRTGVRSIRGDSNNTYGNDQGYWTHDPYGYGWGGMAGSFRSLEVSSSGNFSTEPAIFRLHQWGSGAMEFYKPQGTVVYLRETPGGGGTWFNRLDVQASMNVSGNFGLGTTGPVSKLEVYDSASNAMRGITVTNADVTNGKAYIAFKGYDWVQGAVWHDRAIGGLEIGTNPDTTNLTIGGVVSRMHISNNGYVGIGTASPSTKLHVFGSAYTAVNLSEMFNSPVFRVQPRSDETSSLFIATVGNSAMGIQGASGTAATNNIAIQPFGGNVAIGTTNPQSHASGQSLKFLQVGGTNQLDNTPFQDAIVITSRHTAETGGETFDPAKPSVGIRFTGDFSDPAQGQNTSIAGIYAYRSGGWRGGLVFRTKTGTNAGNPGASHDVNAMVISPAGRVGIGTNSPAYSLDVTGDIRATGTIYGTGGTQVPIGTGTANYLPKWTASGTLGDSLLFDNGTNVGIGTAAPNSWAKLDVNGDLSVRGSGGAQAVITSEGGSRNLLLKARGGDYWDLYITTGGNVGIGTAGPNAKLDVSGSTTPGIFVTSTNYPTTYRTQLGTQAGAQGILVLGNNGVNEIRFGASATGGLGYIYTNNTADYSSTANGNLAMTFAASGNVGIGTAGPATKLTVAGDMNMKAASGGTSYKLYFGDEVTSGPGKAIFMEGYYMKIQGHRNEGIRLQGVDANGSVQEFATFYGDNNAKASQIHLAPSGGNVGINTTSPAAKLDVANTSPATWTYGGLAGNYSLNLGRSDGTGVGSIKLNAYSAGQFVFIRPSNGNMHVDSTTGQYYFNWDSGVYGANAGVIHMANGSGTETVRFDSNSSSWLTGGNVGIGTASPQRPLDIGGSTSAENLRVQGSLKTYDGTVNSTGTWHFGAGAFSGDTNKFVIYHVPNSAKVVVDTAGNVGIGTGNPTYGLYVNGPSLSGPSVFITNKRGGYSPLVVNVAEGDYHGIVVEHKVGSGGGGCGSGGCSGFKFDDQRTDTFSGAYSSSFYINRSGAFSISPVFQVDTHGVIGLTVANSGSVGIGTTSPTAQLDVYNSSVNNAAFQGLLRIGVNNTTESSDGTFNEAAPSYGLEFTRDWTSGGQRNVQAGIYAWGSGSWSSGLAFRTASTGPSMGTRMVITGSSGNVGINTLSPSYKLDVTGDIRATGNIYAGNMNVSSGSTTLANLTVGPRDNGAVIFYRNTNPYTIGNTDAVLTVSDRSGADWGVLIDKTGAGYGLLLRIAQGHDYGIRQLNDSDAETFRVNGAGSLFSQGTGYFAGNVGIGTAGPAAKLHVSGGPLLLESGGANTYGQIKGYNNNNHFITMRGIVDSSGNVSGGHQATWVEYLNPADSSTGWFFKDSSVAGYPTVARISKDSSYFSGNVGINTTSPQRKLDIEGNNSMGTNNAINNDGNDRPGMVIRGYYPELNLISNIYNGGGNAHHGPTLRFVAYDDANTWKHWVIGTSGTAADHLDIGYAANQSNPHMGIANYDTSWGGSSGWTTMRIMSNGNVGIGKYGYNITNPAYPLDVKGTLVTRSTVNNGLVTVASWSGNQGGYFDVYYDGTPQVHLSAGPASGPSYINNGNLGIGTASPTTGAKLHLLQSSYQFIDLAVESALPSIRLVDNETNQVAYGFLADGSNLYFDSYAYANRYANGYGTHVMTFSGGNVSMGGTLTVSGYIYKNGGGFQIDHPLDPANKVLVHSFVESPDMKNIYDGVAVLNEKGETTVKMPDYFQALNRDFRYQLTPLGAPASLYVKKEIENNEFIIAGGLSGMKVSWQVTGTRQDAYAEKHRIKVEEEKGSRLGLPEKGKYLTPEFYSKLETKE